jgi:hypothetical protein
VASWPDPDGRHTALGLDQRRLGSIVPVPSSQEIRGLQATGLDSGAWCADGHSDDLPPDQRADDGRSLTFDSDPLTGPLEILGFPVAVLELESNRPQALVAVRLCEVASDGRSLLVARGFLNLTHRDSHAEPEPLAAGRRYLVRVPFDAIGHRFQAGSRLRLAISPTSWPLAWPSPEPVTLTIHCDGQSRLELPTRLLAPGAPVVFEEPAEPPPLPYETLRPAVGRRAITHDLSSSRSELVFDWDMGGLFRLTRDGVESEDAATARYSIVEGDPLSARVECQGRAIIGRGDWQTRVEVTGLMTSTARDFHVTQTLDAYEGQTRVFARTGSVTFPRDNV